MKQRSAQAELRLRSLCVSTSMLPLATGGDEANIPDSYRTTLNTRETTEDHDEQENMLKACHKRCAERTLVVLEKNGGIFIKLGVVVINLKFNFLYLIP